MSYVSSTLQKGEKVLLQAKLHWIVYVWPCLLLIFGAWSWLLYLSLSDDSDLWAVALFFICWSVYEFLRRWCIEMAVTDKRVVLRKGIISIDSDEIKNLKVEGIEVEQSVMGRILNYGDVAFSGVGVAKLRFSDVARPRDVKRHAEEITGE